MLIMLNILIALELTIFQNKFIGNKNIIPNIYRIQAYDSIMCGYFCIGFIEFMLKVCQIIKKLFSHNEYEKNDKMILKYLH